MSGDNCSTQIVTPKDLVLALRDHLSRASVELRERAQVIKVADEQVPAESGEKPIMLGAPGLLNFSQDKTVIIWEPFLDELLSTVQLPLAWNALTAGRQIVLTNAAWRDAQFLPFPNVHKCFLPPITLPPLKMPRSKAILLVDRRGRQEDVERLRSLVQQWGYILHVGSSGQYEDRIQSAIHLHIGSHSLFSRPLRVLDSWASRRLVIQIEREQGGRLGPGEEPIKVASGENGMVVSTLSEVGSVMRRLERDQQLFEQITAVAHRKALELQADWDVAVKRILA